MKLIIIGLSLMSFATASLEPVGYKPPVSTATSDQYLPPSYRSASPRKSLTPESHYLPSNHQSPSQNVIPNSLYLPGNHGPNPLHNSVSPPLATLPGQNYLPPHSPVTTQISSRSRHHHNHHGPSAIQDTAVGHHVSSNLPSSSHHSANRNIVSSQYLTPSQRPETFTQAIPSSTYVPANQNQYPGNQPPTSIVPPPSTYLTPNKFPTDIPSGDFAVPHDHHRDDVHANSGSLNQPAGHYYPQSGYPRNTGKSRGYNYDQPPVKYEFEYRVNDEYGNDYSHKESRDGDNTQGVYTVLLPDGRKQIVHYKADRDGYRPTITYEDAPLSGQSGYNQGYQY